MTENKQPTEIQIREFWEWCGLSVRRHSEGYWHMWFNPDGAFLGNNPPDIDLNNLFLYAVPMIRQKELWFELQRTGIENLIWEINTNPALALFWAIYSIIHTEE